MSDISTSSLGGISKGDTASRPETTSNGSLYYNTETSILEVYDSGWWLPNTVAGVPTSVTATNQGSGRAFNNGQASVAFTPATSGGKATSFTVTSTPGSFTNTGSSSPIVVTGLQSSTQYTYAVTATGPLGTSSASSASTGVTATTVPQSPTINSVTGGDTQASVAFTAGSTGGSAITGFTVTSSPGGLTASGASSPLIVTGLTNGTSYTFTAVATNANGTSEASSASSSLTPSSLGTRAVFAGGAFGYSVNVMDYVNIASIGNATDFGDLLVNTESNAGASSVVRGLSASGESAVGRNTKIDYFTIATTGNSLNFGDLIAGAYWLAGTSNGTRALFGSGTESSGTVSNRMTYVTIANTGNATNFGNLITADARYRAMGSASSSTRALFAGGAGAANSFQSSIVYFTIATTGNSTNFGNLTVARAFMSGGASSSTRALFAGGNTDSSVNVIDYVTIESAGNATDFGDLSYSAQSATTSTYTRAVHARTSGNNNAIDYTTIATAGNSSSFGQLTVNRSNGMAAVSSGHGGL